MRHAARRNDDDVGLLGHDALCIGPNIETHADAQLGALRHAPVDDAHHFPAPRTLRGQPDLTSCVVRGFEHHDLVPAFAGDAGGLQAGRPRTNDDDLALGGSLRNLMRHAEFAAGRGVVDAEGRSTLVDPVQAIVGADAGSNVLLTARDDFSHDVRVGHVGPCHAHHVHLARGDRVPCSGYIRDPARVERGEVRCRPDLAGEIEMGRTRHSLDRNDVGQPGIRIDVAAYDVQEIDQPAVLEFLRDRQAFRRRESPLEHLVGGITNADQELVAYTLANGFQHFEGETKAVVERTSVGRVQRVGQG